MTLKKNRHPRAGGDLHQHTQSYQFNTTIVIPAQAGTSISKKGLRAVRKAKTSGEAAA